MSRRSYHPPTGSVLALGHNVFYKTNSFDRNQPARWPIYAVWKDGEWGPRQKLVWDDPRGSYIYSNNCGQRVMLPDGDVMMSFTFGVKDKPRAVCGVLLLVRRKGTRRQEDRTRDHESEGARTAGALAHPIQGTLLPHDPRRGQSRLRRRERRRIELRAEAGVGLG